MKQNALTSFIVASSLPVVIWPLLGLAVASRRSGADLDFSMVGINMPLIFGAFDAIIFEQLHKTHKAYCCLVGI